MPTATLTPTLTLSRDQLARAVALAARASKTNSPLPETKTVKIDLYEAGARLTCCNLDTAIETSVGVVDPHPTSQSTCVDAKLLADYLGSVGGLDVTLKLTSGKLTVDAGGNVARFVTMDAGRFPSPTPLPNPTAFTLPRAVLLDAVAQVAYAAAGDDSRPVLAGVLIERDEQSCKARPPGGPTRSCVVQEPSRSEPVAVSPETLPAWCRRH